MGACFAGSAQTPPLQVSQAAPSQTQTFTANQLSDLVASIALYPDGHVTAAAGVVHYYWLVKSDIRLPVLYGVIVTILLVYSIPVLGRSRPRIPAYGAAESV